MEELGNAISKKNILFFLFLAIVAVAIPVSLKLAQTQTQLKSKAADSCPATTSICQGYSTYTTCIDDFGYKNDTERFCRSDRGGGTTFRCYDASNPNNCFSAPSGTYNYSCSGCSNLAAAPAPVPAQPAAPAPAAPQPPAQSGGTCSGEIYQGITLPTYLLGFKWNLEEKYGPNTCNIFARDKNGDHKVSSECSGDTGTSSDDPLYGIQPVAGQTYELFVSNGDPSGSCYNQSKGKVTLQALAGGSTGGTGGTSTCPTTSLQNISNDDLIAKCTLAEIAQLSNDRLATFPMSILVQLPNSRLEQFSLEFLAKFSNERLEQLSLATLGKLPNDRLEKFTIPFLQKFSNDRLITMRTEVLKQFPSERIKTFPCEIQVKLGFSCSGAAAPPAETLKTKCFVLSQDAGAVNGVTSCSDALAKPYTGNNLQVSKPLQNKTNGDENTFYVKFISTTGTQSQVFSKKITFKTAGTSGTAPTISNLNCQRDSVTVTGTNFGAEQGSGKITVNGRQMNVTRWNATSITATPSQPLEGNVSVQVKLGDNQTVADQCTVNTTTVSFTALNSCRRPGDDFSASNVEVKIFDATSTETTAQPLVEQTISLDKNGKALSFLPKLAQNRAHTVIVKAPGTLPLAKTFTPTGGTFNLGQLTLPAGDLLPLTLAPGEKPKINAFDANELKRQWSLVADVSRLADLDGNKRVNSLDYSCLLSNYNKEGDTFAPATLPSAGSQGAKTANLSGRVFADSNSNGTFDSGEQLISGISVKILQEPNSHTIGQPLTTAERNASVTLGQTTTNSSGNYSTTVTVPANTLWIAAFVDAGAVTDLGGGQHDIGIGALSSDQQSFTFNSINVPLASSPANIMVANSGLTGPAPNSSTGACIQVITPARNPSTNACVSFPTPCDVPAGWQVVQACN